MLLRTFPSPLAAHALQKSSTGRLLSTDARPSALIVGAAGAVGKRLCKALSERGHRVIASDRMPTLPGSIQRDVVPSGGITVGGVDVTNLASLEALFREHADEHTAVWNLAAPLSVETALDPAVAEAVTIGGMQNVLEAMRTVGARRICFTDSIGSFGAASPRVGASARWLIENPEQDSGSDYGRQKKGCRDLMASYAEQYGFDTRFAVLPGVLHTNAVWGNGTTEYALDALLKAPHQATRLGLPPEGAFECPIPFDVTMPMIFVDDLMRGLCALHEADEADLHEPQRGYAIPGLSFSPTELFAEIRKHHPGFGYRLEIDPHMTKFACLWPDELSSKEALRDLGYFPEIGVATMVAKVLQAHEDRNEATAAAFKQIDFADSSIEGHLTRQGITSHIRKYLVMGREDYSETGQDKVRALVDRLMNELDTNRDGLVSWRTFSEWSRRTTVDKEVRTSLDAP